MKKGNDVTLKQFVKDICPPALWRMGKIVFRRKSAASPSLLQEDEVLFSLEELQAYQKLGVFIVAPTDYVNDDSITSLLEWLLQKLPASALLCLHCEPNFTQPVFMGVPCKYFTETKADEFDGIVIASRYYAEQVFWMMNQSHLRGLPIIAPYLSGQPHRLFIRNLLLNLYRHKKTLHALEIGCIEHIGGGHRTTQAIAETLLTNGTLVTIDRNPLSLRLAEYFCRGIPADISFIQGNAIDVLQSGNFSKELPVDFLLLHHTSDYNDYTRGELLLETFKQAEPYLAPCAIVLFQALSLNPENNDSPTQGLLQQYLSKKHYHLCLTKIENAVNPSRWFVVGQTAR